MRIVQHLQHIAADIEQSGTGEVVLHLITEAMDPAEEKQLANILEGAMASVEAALKLAELL